MLPKPLQVVLLWCLFPPAAIADQYSYVTLQQATSALDVLPAGQQIHEFCAPCGDVVSHPIEIKLVEIGRVWEGESASAYRSAEGESYWQVFVNDAPIDLAYVYVPAGSKWENLAMHLGLDATGVPRHLDARRTGVCSGSDC